MHFKRCSLAVVVSLFTILGLAQTAAADPAPLTPRATIQSAVVSGRNVRVTLSVVLAPISSAAACTGRVTATVRLSSRRSVRASGRLSAGLAGACVATIRLTLPRSRNGRTVSFRLSYSGNEAIRRFNRTVRLRVRNPSASDAGTLNGTWNATEAGSTAAIYKLSVVDGMINSITQVQSYMLTCTLGSISLDGLSWNTPVAITFNPTGMSKTVGPVVGTQGTTTLSLSFVQFGASIGIGSAIGSADKPGATGCPEPVSFQLLKA